MLTVLQRQVSAQIAPRLVSDDNGGGGGGGFTSERL